MLLILFKDLLKAQQLGLFASPTLVAPHFRKDGTMVQAHIRVVKKRPAAPIKARITSAPRPHTPDLFAAHDEPVVIGQTRDLFDAAPAPRAAQADLFAPTVEATETKTPEVKTPAPAPTAPDDVKWFGSQEKADAWIGKKKLSDTHEVVAAMPPFETLEAALTAAAEEYGRNAVFNLGRSTVTAENGEEITIFDNDVGL